MDGTHGALQWRQGNIGRCADKTNDGACDGRNKTPQSMVSWMCEEDVCLQKDGKRWERIEKHTHAYTHTHTTHTAGGVCILSHLARAMIHPRCACPVVHATTTTNRNDIGQAPSRNAREKSAVWGSSKALKTLCGKLRDGKCEHQ